MLSRFSKIFFRAFSLIITLTLLTTYSQATFNLSISMDQSDIDTNINTVPANYKIDNTAAIFPEEKYTAKNFKTFLEFNVANEKRLTSEFDIFDNNDSLIGSIKIRKYMSYPNSTKASFTLEDINIDEQYRRQHHGLEALQLLLSRLHDSPLVPQDAEFWLQYDNTFHSQFPFAENALQKLGFEKLKKTPHLKEFCFKMILKDFKFL